MPNHADEAVSDTVPKELMKLMSKTQGTMQSDEMKKQFKEMRFNRCLQRRPVPQFYHPIIDYLGKLHFYSLVRLTHRELVKMDDIQLYTNIVSGAVFAFRPRTHVPGEPLLLSSAVKIDQKRLAPRMPAFIMNERHQTNKRIGDMVRGVNARVYSNLAKAVTPEGRLDVDKYCELSNEIRADFETHRKAHEEISNILEEAKEKNTTQH